jgi:hypothetical protein
MFWSFLGKHLTYKLILSNAGSVVYNHNHNQWEKRRACASEVPNQPQALRQVRSSCCIGLHCFVCII